MPSQYEPTPPAAPRFIVISPTYNHGPALPGFLEGLKTLALPIIVVNDGSTDGTSHTLEAWQTSGSSARVAVTHEVNQGKAAALRTGFAKARTLGFTHALTIDSDGQHAPADLRSLIERAIRHPRAIIVGARPSRIAGCPWKCLIGRRLSNHFVWVASGVRVLDSQSGLRCYPLDLIDGLGARAGRYAFETEILTRAGWAGVAVIEVPIAGIYEVSGGRVTHFRVGRDTRQAIRMHARLIARSLLPGDPVPRIAAMAVPASIDDSAPQGNPVDPVDPMIGTILHRASWWFGPRRLRLMATGDLQDRKRLAASVATGLFMATVPAYGIKTVVCLWLASRFRLHPGVVIAVSSLSTPPLGFVFVFLSIVVGHVLLHGDAPTFDSLPSWSNFNLAAFRVLLWEWIVGSIIVGAVLALLSYGLVRLLLRSGAERSSGTGK